MDLKTPAWPGFPAIYRAHAWAMYENKTRWWHRSRPGR